MFPSLLVFAAVSLAAVGDRTLAPPEDGRRFGTLVCLAPACGTGNCADAEKSRKLVEWFNSDERLNSLTRTTAFFLYKYEDTMWRTRYAPTHRKGYPTVMIVDYSGGTLVELSGKEIPNSASQLADRIQSEFDSLPTGWAADLDLDCTVQQCEAGRRQDRTRPFFLPAQGEHPFFNRIKGAAEDVAAAFLLFAGLMIVALAFLLGK